MAGETILNNRYELIAQQGSGGMSVIYKATDRALDRTVAIKILRPSLTQDPAFLEKFQQEARSVANLSHPNIVTVHDVGNDGPTHYIVMEMIDGQDLKKLIKAQGALARDKALDISIGMCAGLGFAHRSRIVHADVKPQNILLTKDDLVKVTDFGIAQAYTDTMPQTRADVVWGSPHYFAPEQARGEKPSPASDVYSIGIVMFEMFTGRLPFMGTSQRELAMAHIKDEIPSAHDVNPAVPEEIANIIRKVMSKNPNDRYRQADQLGHILQGFRDRVRGMTATNPPVDRAPAPTVQSNRPVNIPKATIPLPVSPEETYRHSVAPEQPNNAPYNPQPFQQSGVARPPQPFVVNTAQEAQQPFRNVPQQQAYPGGVQQPLPPQPIINPDTGQYNPNVTGGYTGPRMPQRQESSGIDLVTITLVLLAFIAVAGLFPLYLFGVFPALGGG